MTIKEMRVSDLAKKTGLTTKELLVELKKMGSRAGSPSSAVETSAVKQILARHKKETTPADTEKKAKKTTAKKKAPAKVKAKTKAAPKAAKKPAAKKTVAVKKTAKKKVIKAASKKQEAAPLAAPPKKRVLIKKRVAPPAPVAAAEEETRGEISAEALTPASPDTPQVPPVLEEQAVPGAAPSSPVSPAGLAETTEAPSAVKQPGEAPKEAVGAAEEDKGKKKTLKTDLFQQAKEELSSRMRQRGKKAKKPVRSKENAQSEPQFQLSSWRDIRPTTSRRTFPQKKAGPPSDLAEITKPRRKTIKYTEGITVKEFAEVLGQKATDVIRKMMELGTMAGINQPIDSTAATMVAEAFDLKVEAVQPQSAEDVISEEEVKEENLQPRPPVVTIMGHVDHGKTSLLDAIRSTEVAEGEAGGITQHIGAYTIKAGDRTIAFLDTPGHEAFTAMRARGAQVTDIVVLVVAADDGVMPQTVEAINHARAAEVPIIVAINKIDKPEADLERVRRALSEHELVSESWGGETIFVEVSAKKRLHLDKLLEMILLQADVLELKADPTSLPRGVVVEAKMDKGRGPVATILVQSGTLKIGDSFVAGACFGRVRALVDDKGKKVKKAGPSEPVEVVGLLGVPQAGDTFVVVEEEKVAREIASTRQASRRTEELSQRKRVTLDDLYSQIQEGSVKELKIVLRGDVQGSVEALIESMNKLSTPEVKVIVIHNGVGGITESDVLLASASNAIIIGFNVRPESKASALAEKEKVDIRNFSIIYEAIEEIRSAMEGLLEPTFKERVTGRCEIRQVFNITKAGAIAGAYVTEGTITRGSAGVRILRDSVVVYEGKLGSLKRFKEDVREVQSGYECGIGIENFNDIKTGDVIEAFVVDEVATKL